MKSSSDYETVAMAHARPLGGMALSAVETTRGAVEAVAGASGSLSKGEGGGGARFLVVGAGLSGAVVAREAAEKGIKVLVRVFPARYVPPEVNKCISRPFFYPLLLRLLTNDTTQAATATTILTKKPAFAWPSMVSDDATCERETHNTDCLFARRFHKLSFVSFILLVQARTSSTQTRSARGRT